MTSSAGSAGRGGADDAALIERSWEEPAAFTGIFDRYAPVLHRYVTGRVGHAVADDVVGDTFLVAFQRRKTYDVTRADARPWLYGIASNMIRRHRRAEARAYRALARSCLDQVPEPGTERVEARVVAQSMGRELAAGLARLPRRDRDVVLLVAWAELSSDQVADALGIPVGTVRSRLHRARYKLRAALGVTDSTMVAEEHTHG